VPALFHENDAFVRFLESGGAFTRQFSRVGERGMGDQGGGPTFPTSVSRSAQALKNGLDRSVEAARVGARATIALSLQHNGFHMPVGR
jgi:hypothetical protein